MDRLDISSAQSVTNLITLGHTALSVYDNVALFYTVQEYIMKNEKILGKQILNVYYTKTVCYMYIHHNTTPQHNFIHVCT